MSCVNLCSLSPFTVLQVTKVTADGATDVDMEVVTTETVWREVRRGYVMYP